MRHIVQIELTNYCNRRCAYCGQVNMTRPKGFMSRETIERCIEVLLYLHQYSVGLHHYGESLMHPDFIWTIEQMNVAGIVPWINTNGDFLSDRMIENISKCKIQSLVISGHGEMSVRIELQRKCLDLGIRAFYQVDLTADLVTDIASQVPFATHKTAKVLSDPARRCRFLAEEQGIVLWNGDLVPCCYDYDGVGIFGNIMDSVDAVPKVNRLCSQCEGHPGNVIE